MNIINKNFYKKFFIFTFFTILSILFIFIINEFADNYGKLTIYKNFSSLIKLLLLRIFIYLFKVFPLIIFLTLNLSISFLYESFYLKRIYLAGISKIKIYSFIFIVYSTLFFISIINLNLFIPHLFKSHDEKVAEFFFDKPQFLISPYSFNRINKNIYLYFTRINNNNEFENLIIYQTHGGLIKRNIHVKKAYINKSGKLILNDGIIITFDKNSKIFKHKIINKKIELNEIINNFNIYNLIPSSNNFFYSTNTIKLIKLILDKKNKYKYYELYEFNNKKLFFLTNAIFLR